MEYTTISDSLVTTASVITSTISGVCNIIAIALLAIFLTRAIVAAQLKQRLAALQIIGLMFIVWLAQILIVFALASTLFAGILAGLNDTQLSISYEISSSIVSVIGVIAITQYIRKMNKRLNNEQQETIQTLEIEDDEILSLVNTLSFSSGATEEEMWQAHSSLHEKLQGSENEFHCQ